MLNSYEKIEKLLWHIFDRKSLSDKHRKRLEWELREIDVQGKSDHLIKMFKDKVRCDGNENNLISFWLLGLCQEFDVDRDPKFTQGDMPDIDVDYLSEVRDYLKNKWACETFGVDYVCNIGNYTTFGIKSALIDMARVHGLPRGDMLELTKNLDAKDDEGKTMTWESAMNLYPKLKEYCDANPDVAESARKLINRNRGMGQHAGGLIISSIPLHDLVPLVKRKDNPQASAWVEGLNGQDLQPVGLVKFDLLVISNLQQISSCCELVKKNHNMDSICALPGQSDWSDVQRWRNDPQSLAMADVGDLKCIFQFDSEGIRRLVKSGGVDRFEDLVAYTALYRPGPLGMLMHERYTKRKRGEESYELHPLVQPILGDTYGVMVYQEQIMRILNKVGEIPLRDCEIVRKAISKKKVEAFQKYKNMFVSNGQKNLQTTEEDIVSLWNQVQAFSEYGFNKTMHQDTVIGCVDGQKKIKDVKAGDKVYCIDEKGQKEQTEVVAVHDHGVIEVVEVTFDDGYSVKCTVDHKFLTEEGQVPLREIIENNMYVFAYPTDHEKASSATQDQATTEGRSAVTGTGHHAPISDTGGLVRRRVLRAVPVGKRRCYDLEVSCSTHNFILPNGVVTSNSHAVAYSYVSARLLYFKAHYPHEFYTSVLGCETLSEKIKEYKIEAKNHGVDMHGVDINKSKSTFELVGDSIYYGLSNVKGIGQVPAKKIVDNQPYAGFEDFLTRFGTDANIVKCVVGLRCFSDSNPITLWKFYEHFKECQKKLDDKKKRFLASMEQYDVEFLELFPEDSRSLSSFHGDSPFGGPEWARFDIDEVIETEKTVECDQSQGKPKLEMEYVPIQGTDDFVEVQTIRNYKSIKVKKNWNRLKELKRLWSRREKAMARLEDSKSLSLPTLASFKPNDFEIDKDFAKELRNKVACEMKYYGFAWIHNVENSPDFKGNTFQTLRENDGCVCPVEVEVVSRKVCKSKKGNSYLQLEVEDAMGEKNRLNVWEDDVARWDREMKKGNLLRLRLMPPDKGFSTYTLEQNKKMPNKGWAYRFPTKDSDYRVFVMKPPVSAEDKYQTEDEVLEQFGNCIMEDKK